MKRLAFLILFGCSVWAQTTPTTVIGTVTNPSGTGLTGKVYITWSRFTAAGGEIIPAPTRPLEVAVTSGTFSVDLIPNDTALPAGTGYTVWYSFYPGLTETWTVPTSGSDVNAADIATTDSVDATFTVALTQLTRGGATTNQCLIWNGYWQAQTCPGSGVWGSITGTLSTQTDLQNALNAKAATSHTHNATTDLASGTVPVARLPVLVGDSGSGGTAGIVPAPSTGDAAALKFLKADGTWATTPPGFANPLTTRGDIIVQLSGGTGRLALGANGYCLTSDGTDATWAACPSGFADPMSTRGDLIVRGPSGTTRLAIGTNNYCLKSNGVDPVWGVCSTFTNPMSSQGEMIYGGSSGTATAIVANGTATRKFLRSVSPGGGIGGTPTWDTLQAGDLPNPAVGAKGGVEAKTCSGTDKLATIGTDGVPTCGSDVGFANPLTTRGDLIVQLSGGTGRLALGTNGYCLTSNGTDAVWAACSVAYTAGASGAITIASTVIDIDTAVLCRKSDTCAPTGLQDHSGAEGWNPPERTVATLPTASSNTDKVYMVTDGTSVTDCVTGSGSTRSLCVSNGSAWVTLGASGSAVTITSANTWLLCPLNVCTPSAYNSLVHSPANALDDKVFLVALMPEVTITIRRATISTGAVISNGNTGFAVGIYNAAGTRLTHGRSSTSFSYGGADITLSDEIVLTAGTLYYAAYAAEDADNTNIPVVTMTYQHLSLSAGSRKLVAQCDELASGTGASYSIPATCTIEALADVPDALRYGGANFLP